MRLGSLFSGLGTAEIATKAVFDDARCVFACEIDKYARASFEANVSCEEFYKGIRELDGSKYKGKIDISNRWQSLPRFLSCRLKSRHSRR